MALPPLPSQRLIVGLTLAGLIPFWGLILLKLADVLPADVADRWRAAYAAAILCFMGGTAWGLALPRLAAEPRQMTRAALLAVAWPLLLWATHTWPTEDWFLVLALVALGQWQAERWLGLLTLGWYAPVRATAAGLAAASLALGKLGL